MVLRCIKGIWKYIKRVDILLWLIVAAISAYSLVLLRSVDSAVGTGYFRTQVFAIALGVAGGHCHLPAGLRGAGQFLVPAGGLFRVLNDLYCHFRRGGPGQRRRERRAWINIAGRTFQSSELVKIFFCLTFGKTWTPAQKGAY